MGMEHEVEITGIRRLNHDVVQFLLERPDNYEFKAGQAIELLLTEPEAWGPAPFTFTRLNTDPFLELTIKIYEDHGSLTAALSKLAAGNKVMITDPWDSFMYNGPGVFIAGGAGITPFIALLRQMQADKGIGDSLLLFSNKTPQDVFLHDELKSLLGDRYVDVITRGQPGAGNTQRIDEAFLSKHIKNFEQPLYVCGPPGFVDSIISTLSDMGVDKQMVKVSL